MTLFCRLSRKHYWCTPHRSEDRRLVQVCYECGAERPARELHTEASPEGIHHPSPAASTSPPNVGVKPVGLERPQRRRNDTRVGIGPKTLNRLTLVK